MRAVQLIAFDSNKNPYIPNDAIDLLKSLNTTKLHVIAVAGKYRTGKSYILNRVLLNKNQGFSVGHTINACTKGLWMWPELVTLNGKDCLIIDTEGLGSLEEGESTDLKIFLLALLFSSQLIYNSVGSIDQQAIQSLSLVIQLASVLQRQDKYDSQQLVNTFPAFMWLLRDFSLKLENEKGGLITPVEYLQLALKHQSRTTQAAERKNQIRKQLRTFFQERDCFALVRPTQEERDLQNLSMVDDSKLRPQFVSLVEGLKKRLGDNVKPKRVRGRTLSTQGFIQLCQYYTKALVDGKLPTISSHWDNLCLSETHRIFQKYQLEHLKALQSLQDDLGKMMSTHKLILNEGMEAIDKSFLGKLEKQLFRQRFERKMEGQLQEIRGRASSKRSREVKVMLQSMEQEGWNEEDPLARYERVITKMSQISETSSKDQSHYCQFYLYLCQFARNLLQQAANQRVQQQQSLSNKALLYQQQISAIRKEMQTEREAHQEELQQFRMKINQYQVNNRKEETGKIQKTLTELYQAQSRAKQLTQQLNKAEEALKISQTQICILKNSQKQLTNKLSSVQSSLFQAQKQILQKQSLVSMQLIKSRKLLREKQIIKQRYEQNLQQNLQMRTNMDNLEKQIAELQNKKYAENGYNCADFEKTRKELRFCEEQKKYLNRLLEDQRTAYEAMMQVPQNISYNALRRNLELQSEERKKLSQQLNQLRSLFDNISQITCCKCSSTLPTQHAKEHLTRCFPRVDQSVDNL